MKRVIAVLALAAVCAAPALAQDSTATPLFNTIGDGLQRNIVSEQINTFVVDTEAIQSSWGNTFRVAPLIKATDAAGGDYRTNLMSAQGVSKAQIFDAPFPFASYSYWQAPGGGINDVANDPNLVTQIDASGLTGHQFAVGFADFGLPGMNNIVGGIVNYEPSDPTRLYVARIQAAINGYEESHNNAQFGFGAVDASGNVHFRADDYNLTGPKPIGGNNYFRVDLLERDAGTLNIIDFFAGVHPDPNGFYRDPNATEWLLQNFGTPAGCPSIIPEELAGTVRPVLVGSNFSSQYGYEATAGSTTWAGYLPAGVNDHRGNVSFTPFVRCATGSVGTVGALWKDSTGATNTLGLLDVDANGAILNSYSVTVPSVFTNLPPNNATFGGGTRGIEFDHYHGQTAYRGGPQVAVGQDQAGRTLAAATAYDMQAEDDSYVCRYNAIAVCRSDCGNNVEWELAAYIAKDGTSYDGSEIYGGPGGTTPIGRLVPYSALPFSTRTGPSMSGPAMDSVGNIYFLSSYEQFDTGDFNTGLFRAVYDPATFTYKLELILEYGQELTGQNSTVPYQIQDIRINDSNSVDSATLWSGNIIQTGLAGYDVSGLSTEDPRTLGGLVLEVEVVYDVDSDGDFNGGIGATDESYNVLYIVTGDGDLGPEICLGDSNCDGVVSWRDIDFFVAAQGDNVAGWEAMFGGTPPTCPFENNDVNEDGTVSWRDIDPFVAVQGNVCD